MQSPRQPVLFFNPRSGDGRAVRAGVAEQARERGIEVVVLDGRRGVGTLVDEAVAAGADALGVSGGDGSLAVVAAAAVRYGLPFVCVPGGTRNHFARDLGVDPKDPVAALDAFGCGVERRIDVADVNGRIFLNNVSLGVYGEAVRQPSYRDAKLRTIARVLGPSSAVSGLKLVDDRGRVHREPTVVLVSNNPYALEPPSKPGTRPSLESGRLGIIVLDAPGPAPAPARGWSATAVEMAAAPPVHAGIDGEAVELAPPLRFAVRPGALRVRVAPGRQRERAPRQRRGIRVAQDL